MVQRIFFNTEIYMFFVQFFSDSNHTNKWIKKRELIENFKSYFGERYCLRRYVLDKLKNFIELQDWDLHFDIKHFQEDNKNYDCFFVYAREKKLTHNQPISEITQTAITKIMEIEKSKG